MATWRDLPCKSVSGWKERKSSWEKFVTAETRGPAGVVLAARAGVDRAQGPALSEGDIREVAESAYLFG